MTSDRRPSHEPARDGEIYNVPDRLASAVSEYVVDVKPSARRANGLVGTLVLEEGSRHSFPSRPAADAWARQLTRDGDRYVWVRTANPNDESDVDAYLVSRRPARGGVLRVSERRGEEGSLAAFEG